MARYRIHTHQSDQQAWSLLPIIFRNSPFRDFFKPADRYTLIIFPTQRNFVLNSRKLQQALTKVDESGEKIVVIVADFTIEAKQLAEKSNIEIFGVRNDTFWTDESWHSIRQGDRS